MANFNFGIDCSSTESAESLVAKISDTDIYQDGLDAEDERVSVISHQALLEVLKKFAAENSEALTVEVWPEDMEYDEADDSGDLEVHSF